MPGEAAIIAIAQVIVAIFGYAEKHRETMSPELRNRFDAVQIAALERWEQFLSLMEVKR